MKLLPALASLALALPVPAAAQQGDPPTAFRDTKDEIERDQALGKNVTSQREGRIAVFGYGKCVAAKHPREAHRVLTMDFTTTDYRTGLRMLGTDAERECANRSVGAGNVLRTANLLFAGSLAEALLETPAEPLNARLAKSAAATAPVFGPLDAVAQCLARSLPDQTAALFASEPASAAEEAATKPLLQALPACQRAAGVQRRVELSTSALRAVLATASYRLVSGSDHAQG